MCQPTRCSFAESSMCCILLRGSATIGEDIVAACSQAFGGPDFKVHILIHNAGVNRNNLLQHIKLEDYDFVVSGLCGALPSEEEGKPRSLSSGVALSDERECAGTHPHLSGALASHPETRWWPHHHVVFSVCPAGSRSYSDFAWSIALYQR